ncbi:AAA domain-containing protein [Hymenobacter sp. RP-2-7]|uniref:AAA domain-containing protein n=1 Tax=Hymenobacter polaris TaxID=2682546 RepID=A0A7Y0FMR6_9BACT|nr:AAA family ATPase [Hymenobacter polaris]NML66162.1 AAA domain-containing protein [Hymenobacter polaris]
MQQALAGYREQGQTEFVTFHQAFGYEDFVEGIKPYEKENDQLGYRIEDGVFKRMCRQARQAWLAAVSGQPAPVALQLVAADFDELYERFAEDLRMRLQQGSPPQLTTRQGMPVEVTAVDTDGTLTLIHLNSAQFKHRVAPKWIRQIYDTYASIDEIKKVYEELRRLGGPNASLQWAIFNALKLFEQQAAALVAETFNTIPQAIDIPRFVLVIDEINRGNVANIFGELITLLETDKRAGEDNELTVTLPYSKQSFSIPPNLYLLGTMNTADRSIEALDTALRRRFSFTEMLPDAQVLRDHVGDHGVIGEGDDAVDVARLLEALNSRLEQLLDRDHCLGHALLLRVQTLDELREAFRRNILPLLQEYFFGDWGKIGLVLGEAFVQVSGLGSAGRYPLAKFKGYDAAGLRERPVYRLADVASLPAAAFQAIYAG